MTAAQDSRALKPCPFCGAAPTLEGSGKIRWIKCPDESACGTSGMAMGISADDLDRGIEAWNRRAALSAEPVAVPQGWRALAKEARDNCMASIAEDGISDARRQYREELLQRLDAALAAAPQPAAQERKPLTDAQISDLNLEAWKGSGNVTIKFARAIERAHGITGDGP